MRGGAIGYVVLVALSPVWWCDERTKVRSDSASLSVTPQFVDVQDDLERDQPDYGKLEP